MKWRWLHPWHMLAALTALALASCATWRGKSLPAHEVARPKPGPRNPNAWAVLFIGNSYSQGVPREFTKLAAARGIKVRTGQATHDGWSLARHANDADTLALLHGSAWDLVILQEHSLAPSSRQRRLLDMQPALLRLAEEARSAGASPMLVQTWGRRDGDPANPRGGFHAMNDQVREGCRRAARRAGVALIPAGDAWQREVDAGRADMIFHADGSHPTRRGNQITADAVLQAMGIE